MIAAAVPVENLAHHEGTRRRVLVIDDEPLIRWALSVGLSAAGFDAVAAANAVEARAMAGAWPQPDVLLLDLHQADCSQLLADLKALAPACHVLVLGTCATSPQRRWQGCDIIAKPFDLRDVVERVEAACGRLPAT
jgi:two-component system response regulator MprA